MPCRRRTREPTHSGTASLVYVNAPEARRLLRCDPIDDSFVDGLAAALVAMILGTDDEGGL